MPDKDKPESEKPEPKGYEDDVSDDEFTEKFMTRMRERAAVHGYLVPRRG